MSSEKAIEGQRRRMMKQTALVILLMIGFLVTGDALAQDPIVFPAEGQSEEQMEKDKFSCYQWARNQTGFDPMEVPKATSPPPQQTAGSGTALKGAAVGAGAGALIKRSGSRSKGAATGAVVGGVIGGAAQAGQRRQDEKARQQWEQEQASQYTAKRNEYNRAYGACMEGKGYTVK
jgi:hypothetical protein